MFKNKTTVTQGAIGLAIAIAWFAENDYIVSVPLNDNQPYDLIVDKGDGLKRVQVKTTRFKGKGRSNYVTQLKSVRTNKTVNNIKNFDGNSCELVFIVTENKIKYLVPAIDLDGMTALALGEKAEKWKLNEN